METLDLKPYLRRVPYYETDQMGIVHHSNYIRWFEEARDDFVRRNGIAYTQIEAQGILMPVIGVDCVYKTPAKYDEIVAIHTRLTKFNGVRAAYEYEVRRPEDNALIVLGHSDHCFIDRERRKPLNLRRRMPEYSEIMFRLLEAGRKESEG